MLPDRDVRKAAILHDGSSVPFSSGHAVDAGELLQRNSSHNSTGISTTAVPGAVEGLAGVDATDWIVLAAVVVVLLIIDAVILQKIAGTSERKSCMMFTFWLCMGLCYNFYIYEGVGRDQGMVWLHGYFIEWMLSTDNLLIFSLVFRAFRTPKHLVHRALFWGMAFAVPCRLALFMAFSWIQAALGWLKPLLGVFLMLVGGVAYVSFSDEGAVQDASVVRTLKRLLTYRLDAHYGEEDRLFITWAGERRATLLCCVMFCLEIMDVLFALDSVSAKIAEISNQYVAISSTVMAMFGLRAAFFLIDDLMDRVHFLKYGVAFTVSFIGTQLILAVWRDVPGWSTCVASSGILTIFLLVSAFNLMYSKRNEVAND